MPAFVQQLELPLYILVAGAATIAFVALKASQFYQEWSYSRTHGCRPPTHTVSHGPFGLVAMRATFTAAKQRRLLEFVRGWFRMYGNTFKVKMAGRTSIFTMEPKNAQAILAVKFKDFDIGENRNGAFRPLLGHGIFSTDGSRWEHSRALLRPNFTRNQIADINVYETHVSALIRRIPRDGSMVDLQDLFFRMTLDSATEFLFGESVHSLDNPHSSSSSSFGRYFNDAQEGLVMRTRLGSLGRFYRSKKFSEGVVNTRAYVDRFVQKALQHRAALDNGGVSSLDAQKTNDQQYVFLYELSKQTRDKTELTDQLLNILLAGRDTTASLLSITFFTLARRPDIWNKLRREVMALEGQKPSFKDLKSMTYLTWVLNETLRLYPVVPLNQRMANKDTHLPVGGGPDGQDPVFVRKGDGVLYSPYSMHRCPETFGPDADEYRPERWEKLRPGWSYIPFNGGPRICIGQQFALTEAGYTTVKLLQNFEKIESRDTRPFEEGLTLTLASFNGTKVSLTPAGGS